MGLFMSQSRKNLKVKRSHGITMCRYLILHQLLVGIQKGLDCGENDLLGLASVSCSSGFEKGENVRGDLDVCGFHLRNLARVRKTQDVPGLGRAIFFKKTVWDSLCLVALIYSAHYPH
jgi:hypothetical protein